MFKPDTIYFEKDIINYTLGKELMEKYKEIPKIEIENHNNIEEMRTKSNKEFPYMKKNLIIGTRKTHKFVPNHKTSDFLRLFVNREEMLEKIIKTANKSDQKIVFEIGSNSDLILENTITGNLKWTIENFKNVNNGFLTFPTKFDMVDDILPLDHKGKITIRVSVNPSEIINKVEFGRSSLSNRIQAINKLKEAGYNVGILIAPVIFLDNWQSLYLELIEKLNLELSKKVKKDVFFEIIFMTYSYIHTKINEEAFPNAINLYDKDKMTGRGRGKYWYKNNIREEGKQFFIDNMHKFFPNNTIEYIV